MFYEEEIRDALDAEAMGPAYRVNGVPCGTYREALIVAGADLPEQIEEEQRYNDMVQEVENLRRPIALGFCACHPDPWDTDFPF